MALRNAQIGAGTGSDGRGRGTSCVIIHRQRCAGRAAATSKLTLDGNSRRLVSGAEASIPCNNFNTHTGFRTRLTVTPAIMFEHPCLLVIYCYYQWDGEARLWTYSREQGYGNDT